jgi:hypothetical protein
MALSLDGYLRIVCYAPRYPKTLEEILMPARPDRSCKLILESTASPSSYSSRITNLGEYCNGKNTHASARTPTD